MPVIRIDEEVMAELKGHAEPFEDTPNSVLRRVLGLDEKAVEQEGSDEQIIERDTVCRSKDELISLLRRWLSATRQATIGQVGSYGGKPWLRVELDEGGEPDQRRFVLNADTTRRGVSQFLEFHNDGSEEWHVIPNMRGVPNKVTNDPRRKPIRGLYMYIEKA